MSRAENARSSEQGFSVETDALAVYLDALMRPVSDTCVRESISDETVFCPPTETFACLPVTVGGMTLAIPCADVREIFVPPARSSALAPPRRPNWFAGHCQTQTGRGTLVDLAVIIAGAARSSGNLPSAVVVGSKRYALGCDAVGEQFEVQPARVQWRTARTRRPWLAGVETTRRYPVLDIPALERQLMVDEDALVSP